VTFKCVRVAKLKPPQRTLFLCSQMRDHCECAVQTIENNVLNLFGLAFSYPRWSPFEFLSGWVRYGPIAGGAVFSHIGPLIGGHALYLIGLFPRGMGKL